MKDKLTPEIKKQFQEILIQLSPENLSCDGELTPAQTLRKKNQLLTEWRALENKIGMKVSTDTADQW